MLHDLSFLFFFTKCHLLIIYFSVQIVLLFSQTLGQNLNTHPVRLKVKEAICQGY